MYAKHYEHAYCILQAPSTVYTLLFSPAKLFQKLRNDTGINPGDDALTIEHLYEDGLEIISLHAS